MRLDDYKKDIDKISCSPEFKAKMNKLLSQEPDIEYEDSVSTVEPARKIGFTRYAAMAASAVVILGIGGAALMNLRGHFIEPGTITDTDISTDISATMTAFREVPSGGIEPFGMESYYDAVSFGTIPSDIVIEQVFDQIKANEITSEKVTKEQTVVTSETASGSIVMEISSVPYGFDFLTNEPFTYTVDTLGMNKIEQGDRTFYFFMDSYRSIMDAVSMSVAELDWESICTHENADVVADLFKTYGGEFEYFVPGNPNDVTKAVDINNKAAFDVWLSADNVLCVSYYVDNETFIHHYFRTPDGFEKMLDVLYIPTDDNDPVEDTTQATAGTDELIAYMKETFAKRPYLCYQTGQGQYDSRYVLDANADLSAFVDAASKLNWGKVEKYGGNPDHFFNRGFVVGGVLQFPASGDLYDELNEVYYINDDKNSDDPEKIAAMNDMRQALLNIVENSAEASAIYAVCTGTDSYTEMTAPIELSADRIYFDSDGKSYTFKIDGKGKISLTKNNSSFWESDVQIMNEDGSYRACTAPDDSTKFREYGSLIESVIPDSELSVDENGEKYLRLFSWTDDGYYMNYVDYPSFKRAVLSWIAARIDGPGDWSSYYNEEDKKYTFTTNFRTIDLDSGDDADVYYTLTIGEKGDILHCLVSEKDSGDVIRQFEMTIGDGEQDNITYR